MTPERFRECLDIMGYTQRGLAVPLECSADLPRQWANGHISIPETIANWMEDYVRIIKERKLHLPAPPPPPKKDWIRGPWGHKKP